MERVTTAVRVRGVVLPEDEHRDLLLIDGRVAGGERTGEWAERYETAPVVAEGWVVPGLVDAHCHVGLGPDGAVDEDEQERQARSDRDAGALLLRDCGSPADTRWVDGREDLPRIIRAGRHLAAPRRYIRDLGLEVAPEELPAAAEEQARWGNGWVKIVADWIDRSRGDLAPLWPDATLRAAVERAHAAGARVTAHVFAAEAIPGLLDAGIDCLEHGPGLDDALLARMAAQGVALVPTLVNVVDNFPGIAERALRFPAYAAHMRRLHARAPGMVRAAHEAGVAVYAGTDAGGMLRHGRIADEVRALHRAGLPADAALAAASWSARAWLGRPGRLEPGAPADLVVYPGDPRTDLSLLDHRVCVVLRGRVVRPGHAVP